MKRLALLCTMCCCAFLSAQYTVLTTNLPNLSKSHISWADFNQDGLPDLLLGGFEGNYMASIVNRVYLNNGEGGFSNTFTLTSPFSYAASACADFDRDGRIDFAIMGASGSSYNPLQIYRNTGGGTFALAFGTELGLVNGTLDTGDYDGDGDADLLISGSVSNTGYTRILRNDGTNGFTNVPHALPDVKYGDAKWIDYDCDGDLDVSITGEINAAPWRLSRIYVNNHGTYTDSGFTFPALNNSTWEWTDLNQDGFPDCVLMGWTGSEALTNMYINNAGESFTAIPSGLPALQLGKLTWGDLNQDGIPDVVIRGANGSYFNAGVYEGTGLGHYAHVSSLNGYIDNLADGAVTMVDMDADGDLDIVFSGYKDGYQEPYTCVVRNAIASPNTPPTPPSISTVSGGSSLVMSWNAGSDLETHEHSLGYRVIMGTHPGFGDVINPGSDRETGLSYLPLPGEYYGKMQLNQLPSGSYHYAVQAVDGGYQTSPWSAWQSFACLNPGSPWTDSTPFSLTSSAVSPHLLITKSDSQDPTLPPLPAGWSFDTDWALKLEAAEGSAELTLSLGTGIWTVYVYQNGVWSSVPNTPLTVETGSSDLSLPAMGFSAKAQNWLLIGRADLTLPVELNDFFCSALAEGGVLLSWTWYGDVPLLGFRLYRSETDDPATAVLLTPSLIPAQNLPEAEYYSFSDTEVEQEGSYYYWLEAQYHSQANLFGPVYAHLEPPVEDLLPQAFSIGAAYPNPFRTSTCIQIDVKEGHQGVFSIYNLKGQKVLEKPLAAGKHEINWDGRDGKGRRCATGVYFYRFSSDAMNRSGKMLYLGD